MKKITPVLLFLIAVLKLTANPIALPMVLITELFFDPVKGWQLELEYMNTSQEAVPIDSIRVCSSSGSSILKGFQITGDRGFLMVSKDSLFSEVDIHAEGDSITVISYIGLDEDNAMEDSDFLIFGNYKNAVISSPVNGQSIALTGYGFSKDKSPSPGDVNDTTGMCGTLQGIVFNNESLPAADRKFILDFDFVSSGNGYYVTRMLSRHFLSGRIELILQDGNIQSSTQLKTEIIDFDMEPDTVVNLDIFILDNFPSGIRDDDEYAATPVKFYPSILKNYEILHYTIDLPVRSAVCLIELVSPAGKIIFREKIADNEGIIDLPDNLSEGLFIINLRVNSEMNFSSRIRISQ